MKCYFGRGTFPLILFTWCMYRALFILTGINHLLFLGVLYVCPFFLSLFPIVNRATLYTFVFLTKWLHCSKPQVHVSAKLVSEASASLFFYSFIHSFRTGSAHSTEWHSRPFIQRVDIVWMYLHWRFLNGYWGKYLKCRKYVRVAEHKHIGAHPGQRSSASVYLSLQVPGFSSSKAKPLFVFSLIYSSIYYVAVSSCAFDHFWEL